MKYILKTLNPETQEIVSEKEYRSLLQISKDLRPHTAVVIIISFFMSNQTPSHHANDHN